MTNKLTQLIPKLREILQIDQPDLDFGIYRIIRARSDEINNYLENVLPEQVKAELEDAAGKGVETELENLREKLRDDYGRKAFDENGNLLDERAQEDEDGVKYMELFNGAGNYNTAMDFEDDVYTHLLTFFSRYYDRGDFISQRRYKGNTYAIPYSGEEVVLHWANKDQYYVKSSEHATNYTFALDDSRKVQFRLVAADTARDNNKSEQERLFVLAEAGERTRINDDGEQVAEEIKPVEVVNGHLVVRFEYRPVTTDDWSKDRLERKKAASSSDKTPEPAQEDLLLQAMAKVETLLANDDALEGWCRPLFASVRNVNEFRSSLSGVRKKYFNEQDINNHCSLLGKHLRNYTARQTSDYFIHKDLGGFLRRELDFYIKNEVMNLEDVQHARTFNAIEKNLRMIQCLRKIALKLIDFMAQLEEFQKKLWLKKKFVTETNYCITLDRVPEELYPEIAENDAQLNEWIKLGFIEEEDKDKLCDLLKGGSLEEQGDKDLFGNAVEQIKNHTSNIRNLMFLVLDTKFFDESFKARLLASIENFDEQCDGLLVHSENFQALNTLQERYREQVKCVYIDPPYNTGEDGFPYKDKYQHASWLSMMFDRCSLGKGILNKSGVFFSHIDDNELFQFEQVLTANIFGKDHFLGALVWNKRYSPPADTKDFGYVHENVLAYRKSETFKRNLLPLTEDQKARYDNPDNDYRGPWKAMDYTCRYTADERPNLYYPIIQPNTGQHIWPKKSRVWAFSKEEHKKNIAENKLWWGKNGKNTVPAYKNFIDKIQQGIMPSTLLGYEMVGHTDGAAKELRTLFPDLKATPKPTRLGQYLITIGALNSDIILDYFAGSGTTGHAVIDLNREDGGRRKYILVEMGEYFDTVLKPRIQKVVYSQNWKEGKPIPAKNGKSAQAENASHSSASVGGSPFNGVSHCFKYIRLESYEDALNNLSLTRDEQQDELFTNLPEEVREDYLLRYMLDTESRGALLSVDDFRKPFDYRLEVAADSTGARELRKVDLVETFNYLIGLRVQKMDSRKDRGFVRVEGELPDGSKACILWRDCEVVGYEKLNEVCRELGIHPDSDEQKYDLVYVNGDHSIPQRVMSSEADGSVTRELKLRSIEEEFLDKMFDV